MYQRSQYYRSVIQGQDISDFATKNCLQPVLLHNAFDPFSGKFRELYVPCGKCIRCKDQLQREWVTRMSVESNSWKYHYFVTLTFGSYNLHEYKEHPFMADWLSMRPVKDSYNSSHRPCWTPSLLQNGIFTKFIKRLRFATNADLCYMYCGEYGETYGRPHAHFIIFSNDFLTDANFQEAWGYNVYFKQRKYAGKILNYCKTWHKQETAPAFFRIGSVKVYNLTFNGTMSYKRKFDPKEREQNALHVFSYVAKYVTKQQPFCPYVNYRLRNAFLNEKVTPNFYFNEEDVFGEADNKLTQNIEKRTYNIVKYKLTTLRTIKKNGLTYEKVSFENYCKIYSPFFISSRRPAIGKRYALENLEQFANGNFAMEKRFGKQMEFPRYFYKVLFETQYPLRVRIANGDNVSYSKCSLPALYRYFTHLRDYGSEITSLLSTSESTQDVSLRKILLSSGCRISEKPSNILDLHLLVPAIGNLYCRFNSADFNYRLYLFDRSRKCYNQFGVYSLEDFCQFILHLIEKQFEQQPQRETAYLERQEFFKLLNMHPQTKHKIESFIALRREDDLIYKSQHLTKDEL